MVRRMTATPAGWYPDPNDGSLQRYWDGSLWTEHTAPLPPRLPVASAESQSGVVDNPVVVAPLAATGRGAIQCPHCGVRGGVSMRRKKEKKGVSGGKATAAVLTAGISVLAVGLSRKEKVTHMKCRNCKVQWDA